MTIKFKKIESKKILLVIFAILLITLVISTGLKIDRRVKINEFTQKRNQEVMSALRKKGISKPTKTMVMQEMIELRKK